VGQRKEAQTSERGEGVLHPPKRGGKGKEKPPGRKKSGEKNEGSGKQKGPNDGFWAQGETYVFAEKGRQEGRTEGQAARPGKERLDYES